MRGWHWVAVGARPHGFRLLALPPPQTLGHGALHAAVDGLHVDVVALLLSLGANPNLRTHVSTVGACPRRWHTFQFPTASIFTFVGVKLSTCALPALSS